MCVSLCVSCIDVALIPLAVACAGVVSYGSRVLQRVPADSDPEEKGTTPEKLSKHFESLVKQSTSQMKGFDSKSKPP